MPALTITATHRLTFSDGSPVRAASAVTRIADLWLIAQDDANHVALWTQTSPAEPLRVFAGVKGVDHFRSDAGTKHLKPDLEAACTVDVAGDKVALLLGSGSLHNRMRAAVVTRAAGTWRVSAADLSPLYDRVAAALGIPLRTLNLEGACPVGPNLRWFQRGHAQGAPSAAVEIDLAALLAAIGGSADPRDIDVGRVTEYDFGAVHGIPLAVTDAVALADGRIVVSVAAEDAPDAVEDGPVVGSALAVIDADRVVSVVPLPAAAGEDVVKVEGLALESDDAGELRLLGVVDQDDPDRPSLAVSLVLRGV